MNATQAGTSSVAVVRRQPRSSVIFGEESIFAPKGQFEINIDESPEHSGKLAAVRARIAEYNARRILDGIARETTRRTLRYPSVPAVWIQSGLAELSKANHSAALEAFERALELDPQSRTARLGLARVASETGDLMGALTVLRELRSEAVADVDVRVAIAIVIAESNGPIEALAELGEEPALTPRFASFFATRGNLRLASGDYPGAITDLRKVVRLKPYWVQARNVLGIAELKAGNVRSAERRFREATRVGPMYLEGFLNLLRLLMHEQRYQDVLEEAERRGADFVSSPAAIARIASQAALELSEWNTARRWLSAAINKTEDNTQRGRLFNDLGVAYSRMRKHEESARAFASSFDAVPTELAITNRGKALLSAGTPLDAVMWLRSAPFPEESPTSDRQVTLAIALSRARLAADAAVVYEDLVRAGTDEIRVFGLLTGLYTDDLGDLERAIAVGRAGLEKHPLSSWISNNLAYALLNAGRIAEAAQLLDQRLEADAVGRVALTATRGLLELRRGDINAGRRLYDEALAMSQTDAMRTRVRAKRDLEIGRALLRGKESAPASALLLKAAEAGDEAYPYNEHARRELKRLTASAK